MHTQETLICELAKIQITDIGSIREAIESGTPVADYASKHVLEMLRRLRGMVTSARVLEDKIGPRMRSSDAAGRNDDYEAVMQIALAIGRDGKLYTHHRSDCPSYAVIPLLAAAKHLLYTMTHELVEKLGMSDGEAEKAMEIIIRSIVREEFESSWAMAKGIGKE